MGKNGYLVKVGDLPALVDKVNCLLGNECLRKQLSLQAKLLQRDLSVEKISQSYFDFFTTAKILRNK